ncbi:MAG: galactose-phosphate uridylyltransferase [Actinomycetota bacterium]|jgi:UDPglucose--hexose-1-phosphate uridylyltransferase
MTDRADSRIDPYLGTRVHIVGTRQARPNLPSSGCPFCPGGLEAPEPYDVRWFRNRWPAMQGDRCEVVLYTPEHTATFASLGEDGARKVVDLWAERTAALNARDDVHFVLCFENRGPEVGATIAHPHGQIYAYDHIPDRPLRLLESKWAPELAPGERLVADHGDWIASVPYASTYPIALSVAPKLQAPDVVSLDDHARNGLAAMLVDVLGRLDRLYDRPMPYMLWLNQRPSDGNEWPQAWFNIEIVSPWRGPGVPRFIAAAEVACGEYFNPVIPEVLAEQLRALA